MSKYSPRTLLGDVRQISIKLADEAEPIVAEADIVRFFALVARDLPQDADEWDLSGFLIDGEAVSRRVVVEWLNWAYQRTHETSFEEQDDSLRPSGTVAGLYQLLAFADAVGTVKGLLSAFASQVDGLLIEAQLGSQKLKVATDGRSYFFRQGISRELVYVTPGGSYYVGPAAGTEEEVQNFRQQLASQTEQLLHIAYKLQLVPLVKHIHNFVRLKFVEGNIFQGMLDTVFSSRVLDAALGPNPLINKQEWISIATTQPCALIPSSSSDGVAWLSNSNYNSRGHKELLRLKDLPATSPLRQPIKFRATLQQDFMGSNKGTDVNVQLDLFGTSTICVGNITSGVVLMLG